MASKNLSTLIAALERLEARTLMAVDVAVNWISASADNRAVSVEVAITNQGDEVAVGVVIEAELVTKIDSATWMRDVGFPPERDVESLNGQDGFILQGNNAFDRFGGIVSDLGDFNGDGMPDFVIGGDRAYVVYGSESLGEEGLTTAQQIAGDTGFVIEAGSKHLNPESLWPTSLSGAGDFNGDGKNDLLYGASNYMGPDGEVAVGRAYIILGGVDDGDELFLDELGSDGITIIEVAEQSFLGHQVSSLGDVNGDGLSDVGILAAGDPGRVYVVFGSARFGEELKGEDLDGSTGFVLNGHVESGRWLRDVAAAGDLNGDGFDDFVVSNVGNSRVSNHAGEAYVLFGHPEIGADGVMSMQHLEDENGLVITPRNTTDRSVCWPCTSIGKVNDINDDGFDELLIGAERVNYDDRESAGEIYLVFGSENLSSMEQLSLADLDGVDGVTLVGTSQSYSGNSIGDAGDIDGDGTSDLIIGAAGMGGRDGQAFILFGSAIGTEPTIDLGSLNGRNGFRLFPKESNFEKDDSFGISVSKLGDINGDGIDDIVVGSRLGGWNGQGQAYVIFGKHPVSGSGDIRDIVDISPGATVTYSISGSIFPTVPSPLTLQAEAVVDFGQQDSDPTNNSSNLSIDIVPVLSGDINADGKVNFADFLILSSNFGKDIMATRIDGDLTGDEIVDLADFRILSANFGKTLEPA